MDGYRGEDIAPVGYGAMPRSSWTAKSPAFVPKTGLKMKLSAK